MPYIRFSEENSGTFRYFKLPDDRMAIFGRENQCDFQMIMDANISREHFGITKEEDGKISLIDLGSKNGTFLNGRKLVNETVELHNEDEIRAGSQVFHFFRHIPGSTTVQVSVQPATPSAPEKENKGFRTVMSEILGFK